VSGANGEAEKREGALCRLPSIKSNRIAYPKFRQLQLPNPSINRIETCTDVLDTGST
jgi:hypothetical protein